jgi:hypothetical protein
MLEVDAYELANPSLVLDHEHRGGRAGHTSIVAYSGDDGIGDAPEPDVGNPGERHG